jgi:hypothetical protein
MVDGERRDGPGEGTRPKRAPSPVRAAVRKAVKDARDGGRIRPTDEPRVALATTVAAQLDKASVSGPAGEVVRLVDALCKLLDALPLRAEEAPRDDVPAGDPANDRDPYTAGLAELVGAGAAVGDTALP